MSERSLFHSCSSNSIRTIIDQRGEDYTLTLKNVVLGCSNHGQSIIFLKGYLKVFFELYEAYIISISCSACLLVLNKENELFLCLRTSKMLSVRVFDRCE